MLNTPANILKSFQTYSEFEKPSYFYIQYEIMPSCLELNLYLTDNKKNMDRVIDFINIDTNEFELVYKNWCTKDDKDSEIEDDYVYDYFYKSNSRKLTIYINLSYNTLEVMFYYSGTDIETENWILDNNHRIRSEFGEDKAATFKVLSKDDKRFRTEEVKTKPFNLNVDDSYNDDFKAVHEVIVKSMTNDNAGLILLHGTPGTGKTSYIKHLINSFQDKTFIFIQNEFVRELLDPSFVSFLLDNKNAILIIEDAEKVIMSREKSNENSVVSTILQLTDGLFSDYLNIKIICTFNTSIEKIDTALLRKGRMIAYYDFKALTVQKTNELLKISGLEPLDKAMTLADIYNYKNKEFHQTKSKKIGFGS